MSGRLRIGVLGPFEVARNGKSIEIPPGKARALLTLLLLDRGNVVPVDRLVEQLWDGRPPPSASKQVQVYVARLRKLLGEGLLVTSSPGYALRIEDEKLDAARFETLVESARGDPPTAAAKRLREALALWRGPPLVDFSYDEWAQEEIRRLEELHLEALEERIEADLALGRHEQVVGELESLAHAHPLRERVQAQLMLALYRCGRQAEALEAYRSARRRLIEELGLEPSPELQQLERAILAHDPALAAPTRVAPSDSGVAAKVTSRARARRSRLLIIAGAIVLAAVSAGAGVRLSEGGARTLHASPNSIAVVDANHDSVRRVIEHVGRLGGLASGAGAVWATDTVNDFLLRIDPGTETIEDRIQVGHGPTGVAVGDGQVWVVNQLDRTVSEVNPRARKQVGTPFPVGNGAGAIAVGHGSVWVANETDGTLSRIDPAGGSATRTIPLVGTPVGIAIGPQGVWVTSPSTGELLLVDPKDDQVAQQWPIGNGPTGIAVASDDVWVANTPDGTVSRFDPGSGKVTKVPVGDAPAGVAYGNGAVWVADGNDGTLWRIDPKKLSTRHVEVGNEPTDVAFAGKDVWTTVLPSPASHRGGTLRVVSYPSHLSLGRIDPAEPSGFTPLQMLSLTNDGLVTYRRVDGLAGDELVPDLATALPSPSDAGRAYTFQLRRGIRYSNGEPVRPQDFRRGIERAFRLVNGAGWIYSEILGGRTCDANPEKCDLGRGIVADDAADTVTFHLTEPDGDFLYKLAFSAADAVPQGTPPDRDIGSTPLPATGPYMTRSFSPARRWILVRNPRFHMWSADAQPNGFPDRIVMTQYKERELARYVAGVKRGSIDVLAWAGPKYLGRLATRFPSQLHSDSVSITEALALNTRMPPFDRLEVRRALNYAIDRNRIVQYRGGPLAARATCQILAPTQAGYRPYCPYTVDPSAGGSWTAPDYAEAEKLVRASRTQGMKVTLLLAADNAGGVKAGRYVVKVLDQLGYRASLKVLPTTDAEVALMDAPHSRAQIAWFSWNAFFSAAPSEFINYLMCPNFSPHNSIYGNDSSFCRPRIDAQARRASELPAQDPAAAADAWSRIDRELVDEAPRVPLIDYRNTLLLSSRVGNYEYHPFWNFLLDQLWVR